MASAHGRPVLCATIAAVILLGGQRALAQSFGVELHNTLMPASGGMAGTSVARPQDFLSAINGNPAALSQFAGTQFLFGGAWAGPTFNLTQLQSVAPDVDPFSARSTTPGVAAPAVGVSQDLKARGLPLKLGLGLAPAAGGGVNFVRVPESNGTSSNLLVLQLTAAAAMELSERLSAGASLSMGSGFFDGPFVGLGAMVPAYGIRGSVGLSYWLTPGTTLGFYYQSVERFNFQNAIRLALPGGQFDVVRNIHMSLPDNIGLGLANNALLNGRLLLAADVVFKQWDNASLFRSVYHNQWVMQLGAQYNLSRCRLRAGYAYAGNPVAPVDSVTIGGLTLPGGVPAVDYAQAQLAVINRHRFSGGIGIVDALPGINLDLFAGGMPSASQQIGSFTTVSVVSWWVGAGLTWNFGQGRRRGCDETASRRDRNSCVTLAPCCWERS